jgi:hypothetical protein
MYVMLFGLARCIQAFWQISDDCASAANGIVCNDFDNGTFADACAGGVCVGTPATCGNQKVACPLHQRLNFNSTCIPGQTCNAATCCRQCSSTNLVTNGNFVGGLTGWTSDSRWTAPNGDGYVVATTAVGGWQAAMLLSQTVCTLFSVSALKQEQETNGSISS